MYSSLSFGLSSLEKSDTNTWSKYPRHVFQKAELQELVVTIQGITNSYVLSQQIVLLGFCLIFVCGSQTVKDIKYISCAGHVIFTELIEGVEFHKFNIRIFG